ncbi:MAG: hypothetical protein AAFW81_04495 [Pseudomonadota bacterium]
MKNSFGPRSRFTLARAVALAAGLAVFGWVYWTGHDIGVQTERAELIAAIWRHVGHGVVLAPALIAYLWFRFRDVRSGETRPVSRALFGLMALSIVFLIVSGPIVVWTYGADLKIFDWVVIPGPVGDTPWLHDPLEAAHVLIAKATPYLILADAAAWMTALARKRASA